MKISPLDEVGFSFKMSYNGWQSRDVDMPKNHLGTLISKVNNHVRLGDVYVIMTAREVGEQFTFKDYWTSIVMPGKELPPTFLTRYVKFYRQPTLEITRNNQQDAYEVHHLLKQVVKEDWRRFYELAPDPVPPEGFSPDALRALEEKGIVGDQVSVEETVRAFRKNAARG